MSTVADATGKFADRIVELLDIFDLSFFVSGAAGLTALLAAARLHAVPLPGGLARLLDPDKPELGAEIIFVGIVASYAVGLGCFAVGRVARAKLHDTDSAKLMRDAIEHHPVGEVVDLARYLPAAGEAVTDAGDRKLRSLYNRLWVHVRTIPELANTFALVKRYWILAATFDGMGIALLAWLWPVIGGLLLADSLETSQVIIGLTVTSGLIGSALFCWRQAAEYRRYQVDELVATAVHWKALQPAAPTSAG